MKIRANAKKLPQGKTNWKELDAVSDAEIKRRARSDPDAQPLTREQLAAMRRIPDVKRIRLGLGLSQEDFASAYQIPLGTLRDWEQGRSEPDQPSRTLLQVIEQMPDKVKAALEKYRKSSVQT
jgi:putative transcriptional regulator